METKAQSDLVGFTEMSSQRHPEEVSAPDGKRHPENPKTMFFWKTPPPYDREH